MDGTPGRSVSHGSATRSSHVALGISFLRNCNAARFHRNAVRLQRLAAYSQKMLTQVRETTDIEFHHAARGILSVFRTNEAYEAAAEHADALRGEGVNKEVLDTRECLRRGTGPAGYRPADHRWNFLAAR